MTATADMPLMLFDLAPRDEASATDTPAVPCMWHRGERVESTHRVVKAADLMHPRWWQWGGIRPDGACGAVPTRLYICGPRCDQHQPSKTRPYFRRQETQS